MKTNTSPWKSDHQANWRTGDFAGLAAARRRGRENSQGLEPIDKATITSPTVPFQHRLYWHSKSMEVVTDLDSETSVWLCVEMMAEQTLIGL